jgi:predicted nucleotidyltransferase
MVFDPEAFADELARIPNVVAVVLGGSRAAGTHRESSDWDFGIYYDGALDPADVRTLGHDGEVYAPGDWSPLMNGGAWFVIDGVKVDVIYREVDAVAHWIDEANEGRFKVELLNGYIAGFPTTVLVGEVALAKVLRGSLPLTVPTYPDALRASAPPHWRGRRDFHEMYAGFHDERGDAVMAAANRARAAIEEAHAVMAERGQWVLNEKGLLARVRP